MKTEPGDVVVVKLDPTEGAEKKKTRPCLVLTPTSKLGLATVVPITEARGARSSPIFVTITDYAAAGLGKPSVVDTWQLRCVDGSLRFKQRLGSVTDEVMDEVKQRLAYILGIDEKHL